MATTQVITRERLLRLKAVEEEPNRTGFVTTDEEHPSQIVSGGVISGDIGIKDLKNAIPAHCFEPKLTKSFFYLGRDLLYTALLTCFFLYTIPSITAIYPKLYYPLYSLYGFSQGVVWTGLWIIAHEAGHSAFSRIGLLNDTIGWTLHSWLLAPYFSWKSTHRRHHIYANHIEKDHNYVPPRRDEYAALLGLKPGQLDELTEDAPFVLFIRIIFQQLIGWNWYILSNITCPPTALNKPITSAWRNSHFDPWSTLFRDSEAAAIMLSDLGCALTLASLWALKTYVLGSWTQVFWFYVVPWSWTNHWIVMITYLHHSSPELPKYSSEQWTFILGATATMDREFGLIGTHFFHHISSDHVTHHLFSKIPHYYAREATNAIKPLLGGHYKRGGFNWSELKLSFAKCQWVEEDEAKDKAYFGGNKNNKKALWYRIGPSPAPEYQQRRPKDPSEIDLSSKSD